MFSRLNTKFGLGLDSDATPADLMSAALGIAWNNGGDFEFAHRVFRAARINQDIVKRANEEYNNGGSLSNIRIIFNDSDPRST